MSNLKDYVQDLVKNVISTNFFDKIKITASNKEIIVEAVDSGKDIVLKGKFNQPLPNIDGEFGLSNLPLLGHIVSDSEFNSTDSKLEPVYNTNKVLEEFNYTNKSMSYIKYRCMSVKLVPDQPKFVEPNWDLTVTPTKSAIQQFNWASAGLSAYERHFTPEVKNNELVFLIGDDNSANQRGGVVMNTGVTTKFDVDHKYNISYMQSVLKLADTANCEMKFSTKGAIQVSIDTGIGNYRFIFPAKTK